MPKAKSQIAEPDDVSVPIPAGDAPPDRGPDRNVMLRALIRQVLGMRDSDSGQSHSYKVQVAAYALVVRENDDGPEGPRLPRRFVAELLEVSAQTVDYHTDATRARMKAHQSYEAYVETVTEELRERFRMLG